MEPEGADSMLRSWRSGQAEWCADGGKTSTVAHGLAPPFAGQACYSHCREFLDDVVLVSDAQMQHATRVLFEAGIVAEGSGAAALAAVLANKLGDVGGKSVVCTVSGRNIEPSEFASALAGTL